MIKHLNNLSRGVKAAIAIAMLVLVFLTGYFALKSGKENSDHNILTTKKMPADRLTLQHGIDSILASYGMKDGWQKNISVKAKNTSDTAMLITKEVAIPTDLALVELNLEITNFLNDHGLSALVSENPSTKNVAMRIFKSSDSLKTTAGLLNLNYSDTVKRNAAEVYIVITGLDTYDPSDAEKILKALPGMTFAIEAGKNNTEFMSTINENKNDYLLVITSGKTIDSDFNDEMNEQQVKAKVKSLSSEFHGASAVIMIDLIGNLKSIEDEFQKYKIGVYNENIFTKLNLQSDKSLNLFKEITSEAGNGKKIQLYLIGFSPDTFNEFDRTIGVLKKLGFKFRPFREYIKKSAERDSVKREEK